MSDIEGKTSNIQKIFASKKNKLGFLTLEYSGHGKSTGNLLMEIFHLGRKKQKLE